MKNLKHILSLGLIVTNLFGIFPLIPNDLCPFSPKTVQATVLGDNYPSQWQTGIGPDSWGMYLRQCTSFVAFRLSSVNGFHLPLGYGNADSWGHIARQQGFLVDQIPQAGAVAWFDKGVNYSHQQYGHVAWVAEVNGPQVTIEEYNYNAGQGPEKYHRRQIHSSQVSGFIHFKDISSSNHSSQNTLTPTTNPSSKSLLPGKGTYHFKSDCPVKEEAKLGSRTLATYNFGQTVHYDQTLTADGYQWISYIAFSGKRRYIPVEKIHSENAVSNSNQKQTLKNQEFKVGDIISFKGTFKVTQIHGNLISSADLAGGTPSSLNWIDPAPVDETNAAGQKSGNQILAPGELFTIPGKYKVLNIDIPTQGLYIQIGSRTSWVSMARVQKI